MKKNNAFTLIELSIVLVIIGLITGGVLVGQTLIKGAQLRSVATDALAYETAIMAFRDKYGHIPGDMPNATTFFTEAGACPVTTAVATCNGDGDKIIEWGYPTNLETYLAWNHLSRAGLLDKVYFGSHNAAAIVTGGRVPKTKVADNIGFFFKYYTGFGGNRIYQNSGHMLEIGTAGNGTLQGQAFSAADAQSLDLKYDDGEPDTGILLATRGYTGSGWSTECETAGWFTTGNSEYQSTNTTIACRIYRKLKLQ